MEAILSHSSTDHRSMSSPSKRVRNPKRGTQTRSLIPSRMNSLQFPQPPLLPLPIPPNPRQSGSLPTSGSRRNSLSPPHKKHYRDQTHTKPSKKSPKSEPLLPKDIKNKKVVFSEDKDKEEKFSVSAFPLAPPPSSLPMPKLISLKPKMNCKVEATCTRDGFGLVDTGATDNLCRLLNIR